MLTGAGMGFLCLPSKIFEDGNNRNFPIPHGYYDLCRCEDRMEYQFSAVLFRSRSDHNLSPAWVMCTNDVVECIFAAKNFILQEVTIKPWDSTDKVPLHFTVCKSITPLMLQVQNLLS